MMEQRQLEEKDEVKLQSSESIGAEEERAGKFILKIQMKNKEVAFAVHLRMKLKYPRLEIDKTGRLFLC